VCSIELISNSFQYFIVRAGNGIIAIVTLSVFSRLLTPTEYGVYAVGMAIASVASAIFFQWLNVAVGRFYPRHLEDPSKVICVAERGFWAATAAATLLLIVILPFHQIFGLELVLVGILFLITITLGRHSLELQFANVQGAPVQYGLLSWAKGVGALIVGFILIFYGFGALGALLGFLVGLVFALTAFAPNVGLRIPTSGNDKGPTSEMFRFGLPMTLNFLAIVIVDVVDRFMIGVLLGVAYVAPYAVAYDLVQQLVGPVMSVLFLAAFPLIVRDFEVNGAESTRSRLHALGSRLVAVGLPTAVGISVLAAHISDTIFVPGYQQDVAATVPWLAAAIVIAAFKSYYLDVVFQLHQATKYQGYIAILMATVNIVLNLILLPRYGVIAAAWATFVAFAVGALASWFFGKSVFLLPKLGSVYLKSVICCAIMAIVLYLFGPSSGIIWLLTKIVLGVFTYGVMAWLLNVAGCRRLLQA
jgi:O-antigen/teichoic acid export membrane protein